MNNDSFLNNLKKNYSIKDEKIKYSKDRSKKILIPLKELNIQKINKKDMLMDISIKDLLDDEKIIVKIIKKDNKKKLKLLYKLFNDKMNIMRSFCILNCNTEDDKSKISLELSKYYKDGSLSEIKRNQLSIREIKNILKQLLYCQLELFEEYGFIHNNICLSNVLLYISENKINIKYKIQKQILNIDTKNICMLCDLDNSILYKKEYYNQYDKDLLNINRYNKKNTIFKNIIDTFTMFKELLTLEEMIKYDKIINNKYFKNNSIVSYEKCQDQCNSYLAQYYNKTTEYDIFINDSLDVILHYIYIIWKDLYPGDIFIDRGI